MVTSRRVVGGVALCAAASVMLAGCGTDSSDSSAAVSSASAAATSTTSAVPRSATTTNSAAATDNAASGPLLGTAQQVANDGWTATITVGDQVTRRDSFTFTGLTVPVKVDVASGAVRAAPQHWKVHTLSGQTVTGSGAGSIPTAIGSRPLDRAAEGLIPFPSITTADLADDVVITEVALYATATDQDPIARWAFPKPLAVRDIPTME